MYSSLSLLHLHSNNLSILLPEVLLFKFIGLCVKFLWHAAHLELNELHPKKHRLPCCHRRRSIPRYHFFLSAFRKTDLTKYISYSFAVTGDPVIAYLYLICIPVTVQQCHSKAIFRIRSCVPFHHPGLSLPFLYAYSLFLCVYIFQFL